jgi:hypothetical protein
MAGVLYLLRRASPIFVWGVESASLQSWSKASYIIVIVYRVYPFEPPTKKRYSKQIVHSDTQMIDMALMQIKKRGFTSP